MLSEHWAPDSTLKMKHKQRSAKNSLCGNHGGKLRLRWEKLSSQSNAKHSRSKKYPPYNMEKMKQDSKFGKIERETNGTGFIQVVMAVDQHCQERLFQKCIF